MRITHWLIVLSIVVLSVTGIYIGHPFLASPPETGAFITGTIKIVHSYAAIVFTLAVFSRLVWMFLGNSYARWTNFIPVERRRRKGLLSTTGFYLFLLRKPPGFVGHNPLAGLAYILVFFLYFVDDRNRVRALLRERASLLADARLPVPDPALRRRPVRALDPPRRDVAAARASPCTTSTARS